MTKFWRTSMKVGIKELKYLIGEVIDESDLVLEKKKKKNNNSSELDLDSLLGMTNPPPQELQEAVDASQVKGASLDDYLSPSDMPGAKTKAASDAADAETAAKKDAELAELQQNIKTIEQTTNFENFINSCDRASKLIQSISAPDEQDSLFHQAKFVLPGDSNEDPAIPLREFLKEYNKMSFKAPMISNPFNKKQEDYKLDEQSIKKILAASKKIMDLFGKKVESLEGVKGISDFNLLSRPGLFGIKPGDANTWRVEVKKYAREAAATPNPDEGVEETYTKVRKAAIELIEQSKDIASLTDPNAFIKKYGTLYRIIDKLLTKDPSPENVKNVLYINSGGSVPEEESKAFISFVKSIVKSKPESSLTKTFSLARKYKVLSDQDRGDEDLPEIESSIKKLVNSLAALSKIIGQAEIFKFTADGDGGKEYSFIDLSANLYDAVFVNDKLKQDFLESEAVKEFYDKGEEEDVSNFPTSKEKQMKKAGQKIASSLEKAYEAALSLQILNADPERNKEAKFTISGVTLELPSFQDVMQGTVGPDKQKVKDFNKSIQEIYDTSSDEEKSDIQKKHRVVASIIAKYTKVYQVANRGLIGKIFDTDTMAIGGKFGLPKYDISHGFFGGKKVVETLLYGNPSRLLTENKQEISMLYAMAIRESIQDVKNEKHLGIYNKHLNPEINWLIEDIKRNNLEQSVLFYLRGQSKA